MTDDDRKLITLVEVDIDYCARTYGQSPCTAALGATGDRKCFNTRPTCQDPENFAGFPKTLRFGVNADYLPIGRDILPFLKDVTTSPMRLNPGDDLGKRGSARIKFSDHPYHDIGLDKYQSERISGAAQSDGEGYDPAKRGTFWGKFRARNAETFLGRQVQIRRGDVQTQIENLLTQHYIIESIQGPDDQGTFEITAKDLLKLADSDRAQAPRASKGVLSDDLLTYQTEFDLSPSGIGDEEYSASGYLAIGQEVVAFTRSGDTVSISLRGALNTEVSDHDEGDTVQQVLSYENDRIDDILFDLLTTYGNIPPQYINQTQWAAEASAHMPLVYTANITEPTGVRKLLNELTRQVGFNIWWDDVNLSIPLLALKSPPLNVPTITESEWIIGGTMRVREQPEKRISDVWINYGLIDPTQREDDANNYRNTLVRVSNQSRTFNGGQPAITYVYSRWINQFNRSAAEDIATKLLQRFSTPPRQASFDVPIDRFGDIAIGNVFRISHRLIQSPDGGYSTRFWQIVSKDRKEGRVSIIAEEFGLTAVEEGGGSDGVRNIFIDNDVVGLATPGSPPQTLRDVHDSIFQPPIGGETIVVNIADGVLVGGASPGSPAFSVGDWPDGVDITIVNNGSILGYAGRGGTGGAVFDTGENLDGEDGGLALYTRYPITIDNDAGIIAGGGGGGGGGGGTTTVTLPSPLIARGSGGGGGGGAGYAGQTGGDGGNADIDSPGSGAPEQASFGEAGSSGTDTAPGDGGDGGTETRPSGATATGGDGGDGGGLGQPGQDGTAASGGANDLFTSAPGSGGAAGEAIDGDSYVSFTYEGVIHGSRIN